MPAYYRNEYLFSEIYLEEITRQAEHADVLASLNVLREYREYADTRSLKAWQESYVHEVLSALGFNARSAGDHLIHLFPLGSLEKPVSLCYGIMPDEHLDNTTIGRNWAEKIIRSLRQHAFQWGLLTNGRQWRIYHLDELTPYETYLEIDLEAILNDKAREAYQVFYKFLKAENFAALADGQRQFDRFKKESQDKIDYIEKELAKALKQKEEGGEGVLSSLCMGYVEFLRSSGTPDLEDDLLRKIYHGAMLYMFRLLFLLYANARDLLSTENQTRLASTLEESEAIHQRQFDASEQFSLWEQLQTIFVDIDQTYNGGLFSPQESEFTLFIEDTRIGNGYLAQAIYHLSNYQEKNGETRPISYRDMSVRHLGTLYEGLLEHKLFIAKENTEVRIAKDKIQFIPASEGGKIVAGHYIPAGQVYFGSDRTERKSTGSYYTPEYIVDYIVRTTVGEKLAALRTEFLQAEQANLKAYAQALDAQERQSIAALLEENALDFIRQRVLKLSVLDPAMGSGHFLVNATNLIANFITEILNEFEIVGKTITGTNHWRRWVAENCIYGVDLNPLAVELAKLSIWILSMAKNQPLSFLNHHLKIGNSLIGTNLEKIGVFPGTTNPNKVGKTPSLFANDQNFRAAIKRSLEKFSIISSKSSVTINDVLEKKDLLDEIERIFQSYKSIFNFHTSVYFNNRIDELEYYEKINKNNHIRFGDTRRYFNWEIEFPQIFLAVGNDDPYQPGFDVIISNPPYLSIEFIGELERKYFIAEYSSFMKRFDAFGLFVEKPMKILKEGGITGMIIPSSMCNNESFRLLRKLLLEKTLITRIVNLGSNIFQAANNDTMILMYLKGRSTENKTEIFEANQSLDLVNRPGNLLLKNLVDSAIAPNYSFEIRVTSADETLFNKLNSIGQRLGDLSNIFQGFVAGNNDAFIINAGDIVSTNLEKDICKPAVFGNNISRYGVPDQKLFVIYLTREVNLDEYPQVKARLLPYKSVLMTKNPWYSLHRPRVQKNFEYSPKILVQIIRNLSLKRRIVATLDLNSSYADHTLNVIINQSDVYDIRYLLGILNSNLINYYFQKKHVDINIKASYLSDVPIKSIQFDNYKEKKIHDELVSLVDDILRLTKQFQCAAKHEAEYLQQQIRITDQKIDGLVFKLYGLTEQEILTASSSQE